MTKRSYNISAILGLVATCIVMQIGVCAAYTGDGMDSNIRGVPSYREAFEYLDGKNYQRLINTASRGNDPVLNDVLRLELMSLPNNDYSFRQLADFIATHRGWPRLNGVIMIAEQKIPESATSKEIIGWFSVHPPITAAGFYRYVEALTASGRADRATAEIKARWLNGDFTASAQAAFLDHFRPLLTADDHRARLDRLLWDNEATAARAMYSLVDVGHKALSEARLALLDNPIAVAATVSSTKKSKKSKKAKGAPPPTKDELVARVPSSLRNDPGLLQALARVHRKDKRDDEANRILLQRHSKLVRPEAWWEDRSVMARRAMENGDFALAYRLITPHGLESGTKLLEAEFMAGWVALRRLNKPKAALHHFDTMITVAATPISRARAHYWRGRALEELDKTAEAQRSYETASVLNTTFYGQLAMAQIYQNPMINASPEPAIPENIRKQFASRSIIQAIERLYHIGQIDRARAFFRATLDLASQRVEFAMLNELAYRLGQPDWAVNAVKEANQHNMVLAAGGYPVLDNNIPSPPEVAFTHAVIRQESVFNPEARSKADARGLMQMLPSTASETAAKSGIEWRGKDSLYDPDYNLRLGTTFLQKQVSNFDGSYVLALVAYNAGPGRASRWAQTFGNPRDSKVDAVDWIEMIPIYETRNYVQRIIESLQMYRSRLNGGSVPLMIMQDIKR